MRFFPKRADNSKSKPRVEHLRDVRHDSRGIRRKCQCQCQPRSGLGDKSNMPFPRPLDTRMGSVASSWWRQLSIAPGKGQHNLLWYLSHTHSPLKPLLDLVPVYHYHCTVPVGCSMHTVVLSPLQLQTVPSPDKPGPSTGNAPHAHINSPASATYHLSIIELTGIRKKFWQHGFLRLPRGFMI